MNKGSKYDSYNTKKPQKLFLHKYVKTRLPKKYRYLNLLKMAV